jgi:hypothetical protein
MRKKPMAIMMIETQTPYVILITVAERDVTIIERYGVKLYA